MTLDQQTVFERMQTVRPAEIIHGCHDRRSSEIYWSPQQPTVAGIDFEEAVDELEDRLRESVCDATQKRCSSRA